MQEFEISSNRDTTDGYTDADQTDASVIQALRTRAFWHIAVVFFIFVFVNMAVATHIMPYLSSVAVSRENASVIAMSLSLISIAGRLGMGWLADH